VFIVLIILAFSTAVYAGAMVFIAAGLQRLPRPAGSEQPMVSVIIAMRNEARNIPRLLPALLAQEYPRDRLEIVVVDDDSSDDSAVRLQTFIEGSPVRIRLLHSAGREQSMSPKKQALAFAIDRAQGELLLLTDADCIPPPHWVAGMVRYFSGSVGLVVGFSPLEIPPPRSISEQLIALESLSLAALSAGTAGWGRAATCNGRNLAYRKQVYKEVGGFHDIAHLASGDDDLFLKMVVEKTRWRAAYALQPATAVPSQQPRKPKDLIWQRLRHASKSMHYSAPMMVVLSAVYLYNLALLAGLAFSLTTSRSIHWIALLWTMKAAGEGVLLGRFAREMDRQRLLAVFPLAEFLHVFYVVVFGALGPILRVRWKR